VSVERLQADVVVVGSGAGGGVVAAELAAAGRKVVIVEEGAHEPASAFTQRDGDMYRKLFRDAGFQSTEDASVNVLQGSCVGGSTVVNMADVTPLPADLLAFWRTRYDLEGITAGDLAPSEARVRTEIGAGPIAEHNINAGNDALLTGARRLGWQGGVFEDNRVGCIGSGYCQLGCAYDAKRSVLVTYVPKALAHGATLKSGYRVERVRMHKRRAVGIYATGDSARGAQSAELVVDADAVFVCAGAIHTPLILMRSKLRNRSIGRNLSLQPQAPVVARFDRRMRSFRGIPQSVFVDEFEALSTADGFSGFRVEGIFGPPGTASAFLPGFGESAWPILTRYDQLAAALVLVPDRPAGRVRGYNGQFYPRIVYQPQHDVLMRLKQGIEAAGKLYFAAGAKEVYLPLHGAISVDSPAAMCVALERADLAPAAIRLISAHPQGTARMTENPRRGVVDSNFRVRGVQGLYVADSSIFPTTAASHTMLPIMTMADLAARRFLGQA